MEKVILDTNILIEILKNNKVAIKEVEKFDIHYISEVTKMELFYGALNKVELEKLNKFVSLFEIISIDKAISNMASDLIYKYSKSHNLNIPDGLIAATSLMKNISLYTYNLKDFKYIDKINLVSI
ncbi:MAG: type II toxin-antitoxin system VapC family toxin [Campylobacterota bacterium]|nr:type II toxin-antitoxin system VapC family toxin [Campylobacterota bacterium]